MNTTQITATDLTVTLKVDAHGRVDRRQALTAFAEGHYVEPVFGLYRPLVAASLVGHVRGIMPTKTDVIQNAFSDEDDRRIRAYRNGREYLRAAYYDCDGVAELPSLGSADLPEA